MSRVSIVIPTRNRSRLLARCLESLSIQTALPDSFEVLVIDNGSTDDTKETVAAFFGRVPNLRYVLEPHPGLHRGRNRGMLEAGGSVLLFGDDDIRATPTWVEGIRRAFDDGGVALATGNVVPEFEVPPAPWLDALWTRTSDTRWLGWYSVIEFGDRARDISPYLVWGCNFGVRADLLREIGGFNPDGMPAELSLYRGDGETAVSRYVATRGLRARFEPAASVHHWVSRSRLTPDYILKRAELQGISDSYSVIRARRAVSQRDLPRAGARAAYHLARNVLDPLGRKSWAAYWRGFVTHRRAADRDPQLLAWILRSTYVEAARS